MNSNDDAALWAQQWLDAKNTLSAADAERVEQAFQARLLKFVTAPGGESVPDEPEPSVRGRGRSKQRRRAAVVDKTVLALPTPRRIRDREHVKFVAKQPCLACGRRAADGIICDLRNYPRWDAKSAMSSPYRFVAAIIARSIAAVMKRHGG